MVPYGTVVYSMIPKAIPVPQNPSRRLHHLFFPLLAVKKPENDQLGRVDLH
jgi:hypothetical protein